MQSKLPHSIQIKPLTCITCSILNLSSTTNFYGTHHSTKNGHPLNLPLGPTLHQLPLHIIYDHQLPPRHAPTSHAPPHTLFILVDVSISSPLIVVAIPALAPQPLHALDAGPRRSRRAQGQRPRRRRRRRPLRQSCRPARCSHRGAPA